jgi:hydrogenase/urease accessory protein HupE
MVDVVLLLIEAMVAVLGLAVAVRKKKVYGWFIALTFGLYVSDDLMHILEIPTPDIVSNILFMIAGLSMIYAVWRMYKE